MNRMLALSVLTLACLAGCSGEAANDAPVDPAIEAIFAPYSANDQALSAAADWDRPVFSAQTSALIAQWKQHFIDGDVIELQDFGWFCGCQDWDQASFRAAIAHHGEPDAARRIEVPVTVSLGPDSPEDQMRLAMVWERGRWRLDDFRSQALPDGLKASLKRVIAAQGNDGQ